MADGLAHPPFFMSDAANRLEQIIDGDTTSYTYDAANRLATVDGVSYAFDSNGNLLTTGTMTNTWDAANRLIMTNRDNATLQPSYDGLSNRVAQTNGTTTTYFALDVAIGLPEVIYTSAGDAYLHLPGVIVAESTADEVRYLLSDGLGSVRQATDYSRSMSRTTDAKLTAQSLFRQAITALFRPAAAVIFDLLPRHKW